MYSAFSLRLVAHRGIQRSRNVFIIIVINMYRLQNARFCSSSADWSGQGVGLCYRRLGQHLIRHGCVDSLGENNQPITPPHPPPK